MDPKSILLKFGIDVVNSDSQEEDEEEKEIDKLTHLQRDLIKIIHCIRLLHEQVKPEMNQRKKGGTVGSCLYSVLLSFELYLERMKVVKLTQRMSAQESILSWLKEYFEYHNFSLSQIMTMVFTPQKKKKRGNNPS